MDANLLSAILYSQVKGLAIQLAVLKAQVEAAKPMRAMNTLGELSGLLSREPRSTDEEIDSALFSFEWDEHGRQ